MAMVMDIKGSNPLQSSSAKFFSPEPSSYHDCEASTSDNLHRTSNDIYDTECIGEISSSSCIPSVCPETFQTILEHDKQYFNRRSTDDRTMYYRSRLAPGPTSCVFLKMALKRLYAKEDFEVLESLGEGFFGDVYKVRHRITDEVMVLKVGKERERESRKRIKASVLKEVDVLNQLTSHPNLLAFRGVCVDLVENLWNLHILMDYCDMGSLSRLICNRQKCFPWSLRSSLARDISYAMDFVHSKNIMHRDLTSMNVLLQRATNGSLKAVVADFGLSCKIPRGTEKLIQVGTPYWMAPECLKEEFYDEKADVFSFGIILCQMIARIDADPEAGLYRTHNFGLDHVRFTAHCPTDTPLDILNLAFQCCLMDPAARPSFASVYDFFGKFLFSQQKDYETLTLSPIGNDGRLERSLSDATLRSSKSKQSEIHPCIPAQIKQNIRSQNDCKFINAVPLMVLQEDASCAEIDHVNIDEEMRRKSRMEELARSIAVDELSDEVSLDTGNPFMAHEVYKTARKLAFPGLDNRRKLVPETSNLDDRIAITFSADLVSDSRDASEASDHRTNQQACIANISAHPKKISKNLIRRSLSLPSLLADFNKMARLRDCATFDPLLPSSSSASSAAATTVKRSKADIGEQCALKGQMSMAFKNEDQKFTSRRYASGRYKVLNGALFSGSLVEERCAKDFSLSVDEVILSRGIDELDFEHWKSDGDFSEFLQRHEVVMQQPFPVQLITKRPLGRTTGNRTSFVTEAADVENMQNSEKCHSQLKRDTVVMAANKTDNAITLDPFCSGIPKCSSYRDKNFVAQPDNNVQEHVWSSSYCTVL